MKKLALLCIPLFLLLVSCSDDVVPFNVTESNVSSGGPVLANITGTDTPKHECALLEIDEGNEICSTDVQRSGMKVFTCRQVFIHKELPFEHVIIDYWFEDNETAASKKFLWDAKDRGVEPVNDTFMYDLNGNLMVEFLENRAIVRVYEMDKGSCDNLFALLSLVRQRVRELQVNQSADTFK